MTTLPLECERCEETENVKRFVFFDNKDDEYLCFDCRIPIVKARTEGTLLSDTDVPDDPEPAFQQAGLGDY